MLYVSMFLILITGVLLEKSGINEANVSLEDKEANVCYNGNDVTAEQIAECIEDMGFNAFVKVVNGKVLGAAAVTASKNNNVGSEMNGGGDVKIQNETAKCFLHIAVNIKR